MGDVPRGHHYVPKVLLRGFTREGTNEGTLHIVDLVRRTTYKSTPTDTGKEKDFNLIDVPGVDPFVLESTLLAENIEGPAAAGLERIRAGSLPSEGQRAQLLSFIAMQALRTPARRDAHDDFTAQIARRIVDEVTHSDEIFEAAKSAHPELLGMTRAEAKEAGASLIFKNTVASHTATHLPSFGPLVELLARRSWCVLTAPAEGPYFVCCDDPVVLLPTGTRGPDEPRGFASLDAQVLMPVGRRHALFGCWTDRPSSEAWMQSDAGSREVAAMNTGLVLFAADRFVASGEPDFTWLLGEQVADRAAYVELVKKRPLP